MYQETVFVLNEMARWRVAETPALKIGFKRLEDAIRARPNNIDRDVVEGTLRYRLLGGWVWTYVIIGDESRLVYSVVSIDMPTETSVGARVLSGVKQVARTYIPHAADLEKIKTEYDKPR